MISARRVIRRAVATPAVTGALIRWGQRRVRVLMYHGISGQGIPRRQFEGQLRFLSRNFTSYWASELPALLKGQIGGGPRAPVVLTFDDGLRNNATVAAPLLRKHGLKATFYVVSDLVGGERMLWIHELACRLYQSDDLSHCGLPEFPGAPAARWAAVREFVSTLKSRPAEEVEQLLDRVRRATRDFRPAPWMEDAFVTMSDKELRDLPGCIEIGSHSATHCMLDQVSEERARAEILGSKDALEACLRRPVRTFCYPNGNYSDGARALVEQAYDCAVATSEGFADEAKGMHCIPRIPAAHNLDRFLIRLLSPTS